MEKGSLSTHTVLDHFGFFKLGSYLALKLIVLSVSSPFFSSGLWKPHLCPAEVRFAKLCINLISLFNGQMCITISKQYLYLLPIVSGGA